MLERLLRRWRGEPESIGPKECPIVWRWTLLGRIEEESDDAAAEPPRWKLLVHKFTANADDRDVHDHPRSFLTLVLAGGYIDETQCGDCGGVGGECEVCEGWGIFHEEMLPGSMRFRPAMHRHRTRASSIGAWTLVLMGPLEREWGFWPIGPDGMRRWWPWREYRETFGPGMRCP